MPGLPLLAVIQKGLSGKQTHSSWKKKSSVDIELLPSAATNRKITKDGEHKMARNVAPAYESVEDEEDDDEGEDASPEIMNALNGVLIAAKTQVDEFADNYYDPMEGDVYSYFAFGSFLRSVGLMSKEAWRPLRVIRFAGQVLIILVQLVAPAAIGAWAWSGLRWRDYEFGMHAVEHNTHMGRMNYATEMCTRILGVLFLMLFILNGMLVLWKEQKTLRKLLFLNHVFSSPGVIRGLQKVKLRTNALDNEDNIASEVKPIAGCWLYIGPFMNSMVVVVSAAAMLPCFFASETPKDILFDSLGLLFLFTLDNVVSDVGFLDGCWNAELYGTLYGNLWNGRYIDNGVVTQRARKVHGAEESAQDAPRVRSEVLQQWYDEHLHTSMSMITYFNYFAEVLLVLMFIGFPIFFFFSMNIATIDAFEDAANFDLLAAHEKWLSENKDKLMVLIANSAL